MTVFPNLSYDAMCMYPYVHFRVCARAHMQKLTLSLDVCLEVRAKMPLYKALMHEGCLFYRWGYV